MASPEHNRLEIAPGISLAHCPIIDPSAFMKHQYRGTYLADGDITIGLNLCGMGIVDTKFLSDYPDLEALHLGENKLKKISIPAGCTALRFLNVSENATLQSLDFQADLPALEKLEASECVLQALEIPAGFDALKWLDLQKNKLTKIGFLGNCPALEWVDLNGNGLKEFVLPEGFELLEGVFLKENDALGTPPPEIVKQGAEAVAGYFRKLETQGVERLYEAKLILIGDGGSGKTTLSGKLQNPDLELSNEHESTKGVEVHINKYQFPRADGKPFRVNIWDFAGQEKYQAIHQFFYTHRALYVLVENSREQKTDFDYWLETKNLCGDKSPVLIVHNEFSDQNRGQFKIGDYTDRYAVVDEVRVNLATNRGLDELRSAIHYHIQRLPHVGEVLPRFWAEVRLALNQKREKKPYLSLEAYLDLCQEHDTEEKEALDLSSYLHILGAFLHYQDNGLLKQYVILRNEWATDAAYAILEDESIVFKTKGRFMQSDLDRVWSRPDYARMRPQLLELMKKFKLAYQVGERDLYIAPQLLPVTSPDNYAWPDGEDLCLQLRYGFMPKGLLTRFTVTRHLDIAEGQELAWKDGVVLEWHGTRAEVTERYSDREISIRIQGRDRKGLMSIVDKTFEDLHAEFSGIEVEKMIPCNCEGCTAGNRKRHFFRYSQLLKMKDIPDSKIQCGEEPYTMVNVLQLIEDVFDKRPNEKEDKDALFFQEQPRMGASKSSRTIKIFLASSSELAEDRKAFRNFIGEKNDRFEEQGKGVYLKLENWEAMSTGMAAKRKQDDYNQKILTCNVFLCLVHTKVGKYTEEEFDLAWKTFQGSGKPKMFIYFKADGVAPLDVDPSLKRFAKKVKGMGDFPPPYNGYADLERQFEKELDRLCFPV